MEDLVTDEGSMLLESPQDLATEMENSISFPVLLKNWEAFGEYLDVSVLQLLDLKRKVKQGEVDQANIPREILKTWKANQGSNTTFMVLYAALVKCGAHGIADSLITKLLKPSLTVDFLTRYWVQVHGAKEGNLLHEFAQQVLARLAETIPEKEREIPGLILLRTMIAEVYAQDAKRASVLDILALGEQLVVPVSLFEMYRSFVTLRFRVLPDPISKQKYLNAHIYEAFFATLFPSSEHGGGSSQNLLKIPGWIHSFQTYLTGRTEIDEAILHSIGLIEKSHNTPRFIHQSIAEYMLATFIVKGLGNPRVFVDFLFGEILGQKGIILRQRSASDQKIYELKYPLLVYFVEMNMQSYLLDSHWDTFYVPNYPPNCSQNTLSVSSFRPEDVCITIAASCIHGHENILEYATKLLNTCSIGKKMREDFFQDLPQAIIAQSENVLFLKKALEWTKKELKVDFTFHMDKNGKHSPFHTAAKLGKVDFLLYLLEDHKDQIKNIKNLLHACVSGSAGNSETVIEHKLLIIDTLVQKNKNWLEEKDLHFHCPPLLQCNVHLRLLQRLLDHGANINSYSSLHGTLLHWARDKNTYTELVRWALSKGFNLINHTDEFKKTPLMHAIKLFGSVDDDALKLLKEAGADFSAAQDSEGSSVLFYALEYSQDLEFISKLFDYGADWHLTNNKKQNAAHFVVNRRKGNRKEILDVLELLKSKGFDKFQEEDSLGRTALDLARPKEEPNDELTTFLLKISTASAEPTPAPEAGQEQQS